MSPIHDQSYRRYTGTREPLGRAWLVIARAGIRTMLARKWFVTLVLFAWVPFFVRAVQFYIATNVAAVTAHAGSNPFFSITPATFRDFLLNQWLFVFFVTIYVGSGLIANDRRSNALQIYLSKPLMRIEYIAGKISVLLVFLAAVTLVPGLLLLLLYAVFSGSFSFITDHLFLIPAITLGCLLEMAVSAFTILALSSLSKSSRFAGLMYTGAIFFSAALFNILRAVTGGTRVAWISLGANVDQVIDRLFRQTPEFDTPWLVSFIVVCGLLALSVSVLERRVRGVEIVS